MINKITINLKYEGKIISKSFDFKKNNFIIGNVQKGKSFLLELISLIFYSNIDDKMNKNILKTQIDFLDGDVLFKYRDKIKNYGLIDSIDYEIEKNLFSIYKNKNGKFELHLNNEPLSNEDINIYFNSWSKFSAFFEYDLSKKCFELDRDRNFTVEQMRLFIYLKQSESWKKLDSKSSIGNWSDISNNGINTKKAGALCQKRILLGVNFEDKELNAIQEEIEKLNADNNVHDFYEFKEIDKTLKSVNSGYSKLENNSSKEVDEKIDEVLRMKDEILFYKNEIRKLESSNKKTNAIKKKFDSLIKNPFSIMKEGVTFYAWDILAISKKIDDAYELSKLDISELNDKIKKLEEDLGKAIEIDGYQKLKFILKNYTEEFANVYNNDKDFKKEKLKTSKIVTDLKSKMNSRTNEEYVLFYNSLKNFVVNFTDENSKYFSKTDIEFLKEKLFDDSTEITGTALVIRVLIERLFFAKKLSLPILMIDTPFRSEVSSTKTGNEDEEVNLDKNVDYWKIITKILEKFSSLDAQVFIATASKQFVSEHKDDENSILIEKYYWK